MRILKVTIAIAVIYIVASWINSHWIEVPHNYENLTITEAPYPDIAIDLTVKPHKRSRKAMTRRD